MTLRRTAAAFVSAAVIAAFAGSCTAPSETPVQDFTSTTAETAFETAAASTAAETVTVETAAATTKTAAAAETAAAEQTVPDEYLNIKFPDNLTNHFGFTFTEKQLIDYAKKIEADFPYIMGNVLSKLPNLVKPYDESIKVGFEYINAEGNMFAFAGITYEPSLADCFNTTGAENIGENHSYSYILNINVNCIYTSDGEPVYNDEVRGQIAHELMHIVMYNCVPYGMIGEKGSAVFKFPGWFVEGAACVCGFGMHAVVQSLDECGYSKNDNVLREWLKSLWASDPEPSVAGLPDSINYAQGYIAVMYLSYLAGGGTFIDGEPADLSPDIIARGFEWIIQSISIGFSFEKTMGHVFGKQYWSSTKLKEIIGDDDSVAFTKALLKKSGNLSEDEELLYRIVRLSDNNYAMYNGEGSILLDGFDKRTGHTDAPADSTFTLDLYDPAPNVLYQLSYGGTKQVFFGGTYLTSGVDRDGNKPTEFPALEAGEEVA